MVAFADAPATTGGGFSVVEVMVKSGGAAALTVKVTWTVAVRQHLVDPPELPVMVMV